jgi:hypothetical protein
MGMTQDHSHRGGHEEPHGSFWKSRVFLAFHILGALPWLFLLLCPLLHLFMHGHGGHHGQDRSNGSGSEK